MFGVIKQPVIARSSVEAELRSLAYGLCEVLWLKRLLEEVIMTVQGSLKVFCDKKAAINISHNLVHHDRTKHIEVNRHFIKERIEDGIICVVYILTTQQVVDNLTKAPHRPKFEALGDKLGLYNVYNLA